MSPNAEELLPMSPRDYLILLGLSAGPSHGYGLIGEIESLSEGATSMDPANLYRAIKRLKRDGLVEDLGRRGVEATGGTDVDTRRRYYGLTEAGRGAVAAESLRLERLTRVARERLLVPSAEGTR
ncbi:MAG: PadR family transcriptional regulator [Thermoanaerobaculia bacterium]|nr:PadR family transcriptional regulator [Thermoanaerobaculia bacterium]